jgi:hypothetical protein
VRALATSACGAPPRQLNRPPTGRFLPTLLPELDAVFLGYPRGTITEVCGGDGQGQARARCGALTWPRVGGGSWWVRPAVARRSCASRPASLQRSPRPWAALAGVWSTSTRNTPSLRHGTAPAAVCSGVAGVPTALTTKDSLVQMAVARVPHYYSQPEAVAELTERVHVIFADTSAQLLARSAVSGRARPLARTHTGLTRMHGPHGSLRGLEDVVLARGVRLIVLDSVASLARKEFNSASLIERTEVLATQAAILKYARLLMRRWPD